METDKYISKEVRENYDELMSFLLSFAQKQLNKRGGFRPFAAVMRNDGSIEAVAGYDGTESPHPDDMISLLTDGFRARSQELRAAGICIYTVVQIPGDICKRDAVQICLDHSRGKPMDLFIRYRKRFLGKIRLGQIKATEGSRTFFCDGKASDS